MRPLVLPALLLVPLVVIAGQPKPVVSGDPARVERIRKATIFKKDFDTSKFWPEVKAILEGLKKYGMLVADNGIDWAISCTPDERIPVLHDELRKVKGSDFEVIMPPAGYKPAK